MSFVHVWINCFVKFIFYLAQWQWNREERIRKRWRNKRSKTQHTGSLEKSLSSPYVLHGGQGQEG